MVKRKVMDVPKQDKQKTVSPPSSIVEDNEIIELEEVVEEPEELILEEDLESLIFPEDQEVDLDGVNLDKLDVELGVGEESTVVTEEAEVEEDVVEKKTPPKESSPQDLVDSLFDEVVVVENDNETQIADVDEEPMFSLKGHAAHDIPDLDEIVGHLEERLIAKFEEIVEQRLPDLVLKIVRQELELLKKEIDKER